MQLKEPALFPVSSLKHVIELVHNFVISEDVCKIIIFSVRGPENTVFFLIQILFLLVCHIQRVTAKMADTNYWMQHLLPASQTKQQRKTFQYLYVLLLSEVVNVCIHQK